MKLIKGLLLLIILMVIGFGCIWTLKACYDTFPPFHSMLDEVVYYM